MSGDTVTVQHVLSFSSYYDFVCPILLFDCLYFRSLAAQGLVTGALEAGPFAALTETALPRLAAHECLRVFGDRLNRQTDRKWLAATAATAAAARFPSAFPSGEEAASSPRSGPLGEADAEPPSRGGEVWTSPDRGDGIEEGEEGEEGEDGEARRRTPVENKPLDEWLHFGPRLVTERRTLEGYVHETMLREYKRL
eukprot:1195070-Prorocentrum_minimum.AAC.5